MILEKLKTKVEQHDKVGSFYENDSLFGYKVDVWVQWRGAVMVPSVPVTVSLRINVSKINSHRATPPNNVAEMQEW